MFREYKVTDVRVKKDKLFLHIRNLGDIYVNWDHEFPTRILSDKEKQQLYDDIKEHPVLKNYVVTEGGFRRRANGKQIFNNLHIKIPLSLKDILKKDFPTNKYTRNYEPQEPTTSIVDASKDVSENSNQNNSCAREV